jgi:hypothetical protein
MDEARAVLARLERIEALDRAGSPAAVVLEEVRALLAEAEDWVRAEPCGAAPATGALDRCAEALAAGKELAIM